MLFGGGSKTMKNQSCLFYFFLWILMVQWKDGADSLGLRGNAGWNWPPCGLQAIGLCTTFSGLIRYCESNFHFLEANGMQRQHRRQVQPIPHGFPWKCLWNAEPRWPTLEKFAEVTCSGQHVRQRIVTWPPLSSVGESNTDNTRPGICSAREGVSHISKAWF